MPMFNLIEYNDNYSKTSGIFWQYSEDELYINPADGKVLLKKTMILNRLKLKKK